MEAHAGWDAHGSGDRGARINNGNFNIITPVDLQGQDHGNWPRAIYHTVPTLAVIAGVVYVIIWRWSRNPGMQKAHWTNIDRLVGCLHHT